MHALWDSVIVFRNIRYGNLIPFKLDTHTKKTKLNYQTSSAIDTSSGVFTFPHPANKTVSCSCDSTPVY